MSTCEFQYQSCSRICCHIPHSEIEIEEYFSKTAQLYNCGYSYISYQIFQCNFHSMGYWSGKQLKVTSEIIC